MVELLKVLVKHDEDDYCQGHCWWHEVDEVGDGYIRCGECGHLYLTKRALRRAYRAVLWSMIRDAWKRIQLVPLELVWNMLTRKTKDIYFCQLCTHDF